MRRWLALLVLKLGVVSVACGAPEMPPAPDVVWVAIGGETFTLEVAAEPATRFRGLSGRSSIPRNGGMLFVLPRPRPMTMVMRDCPVAIDVAFLDDAGRVVAIHEMRPEPPRGPGESRRAYERRLHPYSSGAPAHFAIETAGGRLRQLGVAPGEKLALDVDALVRRAQ